MLWEFCVLARGRRGSSPWQLTRLALWRGENGIRVPFWFRNSLYFLGETGFDILFQGVSWRRQNQLVSLGSKMVQETVEAATAHEGLFADVFVDFGWRSGDDPGSCKTVVDPMGIFGF